MSNFWEIYNLYKIGCKITSTHREWFGFQANYWKGMTIF